MQFFKWLFFISIIHATHQTVSADELREDKRIWGNITALGNAGYINSDYKRWLWWLEGQFRVQNCCSSDIAPQQSLIRPGIGYALTEESSVWFGAAHLRNYSNRPGERIQENRLWEQYRWSGPTPLGLFGFRSRLEQRWLSNNNDMPLRFRQFLKIATPFFFFPTLDFVLWDEVFVNLYDKKSNSNTRFETGFDQNRAFIGLGYHFNKELWTEIGYMNQFINTRFTKYDDLNHIFSVTLFFNLYK